MSSASATSAVHDGPAPAARAATGVLEARQVPVLHDVIVRGDCFPPLHPRPLPLLGLLLAGAVPQVDRAACDGAVVGSSSLQEVSYSFILCKSLEMRDR